MLENFSVDVYEMFWQVDGDRLNLMPSNYNDYPHKEVEIDVSGWNWKGDGPYVVNFVAKNQSGQTISEKPTTIYITR